jgi:hypothetical protein
VITLQDDLGSRRTVQINITNQACACSGCGRSMPLTGGAVDVQAVIAAELAAMDASVAKLRAYAKTHNISL